MKSSLKSQVTTKIPRLKEPLDESLRTALREAALQIKGGNRMLAQRLALQLQIDPNNLKDFLGSLNLPLSIEQEIFKVPVKFKIRKKK